MCCPALLATTAVGALNMTDTRLAQTGNTLDSTIYSKLQVAVPDTLVFKQPKRGLAGRRVLVKIRAENQAYSTNMNRQIRFLLPNSYLYDFRYGFIEFTFTIATTGGSYARIAQGIWSIFNRMRLRWGSVDIEDIRDWNRIFSILFQASVPNLVATNIGVTDMGIGSQGQRNFQGSTTCTVYMPLWSGVLNSCFIPFHALKDGLYLELFLDDPTTFVETDGTNPQITVSNLVLHGERLDLESQYLQEVYNYVRTYGLEFAYHSWERYINALTTGSTQQITINNKSSSVNCFLNLFVNSAQINTTTVNDKFINWPYILSPGVGLTQYNALINGVVFPDEP